VQTFRLQGKKNPKIKSRRTASLIRARINVMNVRDRFMIFFFPGTPVKIFQPSSLHSPEANSGCNMRRNRALMKSPAVSTKKKKYTKCPAKRCIRFFDCGFVTFHFIYLSNSSLQLKIDDLIKRSFNRNSHIKYNFFFQSNLRLLHFHSVFYKDR